MLIEKVCVSLRKFKLEINPYNLVNFDVYDKLDYALNLTIQNQHNFFAS